MELTISAFIATLQRIIARRGIPSTLRSDNSTNFVGAVKKVHSTFWQFMGGSCQEFQAAP